MLRRFFSAAKNKGKIQKQFLEYLRNKYQEDFVVHNISEVQWEDGIQYRAQFSPIKNPHLQSEAFVMDLQKIFADNYMNDWMSQRLDSLIKDMAEPFFEQEYKVFSYLEPFEFNFPPAEFVNKNMKLEDYLASNFHILENKIWIFVKRDSEIDIGIEAEEIAKFAKRLQKFGFIHFKISTVYVKPDWFEQLKPQEKYTWDAAMEDYYRKNNVWALSSAVINDSNDHTGSIVEEIKNSFEESWGYFK